MSNDVEEEKDAGMKVKMRVVNDAKEPEAAQEEEEEDVWNDSLDSLDNDDKWADSTPPQDDKYTDSYDNNADVDDDDTIFNAQEYEQELLSSSSNLYEEWFNHTSELPTYQQNQQQQQQDQRFLNISYSQWFNNGTFWFTNGTFDVQDFCADTKELTDHLHPANDVDVNGVVASVVLNSVIFCIMMFTYECLRRKFPNVYASRFRRERELRQKSKLLRQNPSATPDPDYPKPTKGKQRFNDLHLPKIHKQKRPLEWIPSVFGVPWKQVREAGGLDAYFFLRYIRLLFRITSVGALWGCIILWPTYATGANDAPGWYHISMANISQGNWRICVSSIFMYFFSFYTFFVIRQEYKHYLECRMEFLGRGISSVEPQKHYSVMIENIPPELRSDAALFEFFNDVFPGKVHSASIILNLPEIDTISQRKMQVTRRLEKSIAYYQATGQRQTHHRGQPRLFCLEVECAPLNLDKCIPCLRSNKNGWIDTTNVEDVDKSQIDKGEKVDSTTYYTKELQNLNKELFLEQRRQLDYAETGNKSARGAAYDWFEAVSEMADQFISDNESIDSEDSVVKKSNDIAWMKSEEQDSLISIEGDSNSSTDSFATVGGWSVGGPTTTNKGSRMDKVKSNVCCHPLPHELSTDQNPTMDLENSIVITNNNNNNNSDLEGADIENQNNSGQQGDIKVAQKEVNTTSNQTQPPPPPTFDYYNTESLFVEDDNESENKSRASRVISRLKQSGKKQLERGRNLLSPIELRMKRSRKRRMPNFDSPDPLMTREQSEFKPKVRIMTAEPDSDAEDVPAFFRHKKAGTPRSSVASNTQMTPKRKMFNKIAARSGLDFGFYLVKIFNRAVANQVKSKKFGKSPMSSTGFVTFLDLNTVTVLTSAPLTDMPYSLSIKVAPEARDIYWPNASNPERSVKEKTWWANFFLIIGVMFWSIPLAFIQFIASAENLAQIRGMEWILTQGNVEILVNAYLPVVLFLSLIMVLPYIFEWIAVSYEGRKTNSDITRSMIDRYFYYQLANIFITVSAGSLWRSAADIIIRPSAMLEILGNSLPTVVGYFISLLVTKILAGLPIVMLRLGPLFRYLVVRSIYRKKYLTQRELDEVYSVWPLYYGWEYPTQLLIIVICFTYASISPVILVFGALFFYCALMVYKKQVLYVVKPEYESGGSLFPMVIDRTITGLMAGQLTFIGYCVIRGGIYQPIILSPLLYISYFMMQYFRKTFDKPSNRLTIVRALQLDDVMEKLAYEKAKKNKKRLSSSQDVRTSIPRKVFSSLHYKQPVLTETASNPLPYRIGHDDPLTKEAIESLGATRHHMWVPERDPADTGNHTDDSRGNKHGVTSPSSANTAISPSYRKKLIYAHMPQEQHQGRRRLVASSAYRAVARKKKVTRRKKNDGLEGQDNSGDEYVEIEDKGDLSPTSKREHKVFWKQMEDSNSGEKDGSDKTIPVLV